MMMTDLDDMLWGVSVRRAKRWILGLAQSGSSSSALADGRKQMAHGISELIAEWVRRHGKRERQAVLDAIRELEADGVLSGELGGCPLMTNHGIPAQRAYSMMREDGLYRADLARTYTLPTWEYASLPGRRRA